MMQDFLLRIIGRHPELFGPSELRRQGQPPFAELPVYPDAERLHGILAGAETQEAQDDAVIGVFRLLIDGMIRSDRLSAQVPASAELGHADPADPDILNRIKNAVMLNQRGELVGGDSEIPMSYAEAQRARVSPAPAGNALHLASGFKIGA